MRLVVNPGIFNDFANLQIAVTVVREVNNDGEIPEFAAKLTEIQDRVQREHGAGPVSQLPKIAAWRDAYRKFGAKAKDYPSSVEALYKRVTRGDRVANINPLVDIYNYISLKYTLPVGGEDIDKMVGDLQLTYASADEPPVLVLGRDDAQAPPPGEVIYRDDESVICRRWNWREVARTALTADTRNCILVIEALEPVTDDELQEAQDELAALVTAYCHGTASNLILNEANPEKGATSA